MKRLNINWFILTLIIFVCCTDTDKSVRVIKQLQSHVDYLSSPDMHGRSPGSRGDTLAREYIAAQYSTIGLNPVLEDGFFQSFPILHRIDSLEEAILYAELSDKEILNFRYGLEEEEDVLSSVDKTRICGLVLRKGIHSLYLAS